MCEQGGCAERAQSMQGSSPTAGPPTQCAACLLAWQASPAAAPATMFPPATMSAHLRDVVAVEGGGLGGQAGGHVGVADACHRAMLHHLWQASTGRGEEGLSWAAGAGRRHTRQGRQRLHVLLHPACGSGRPPPAAAAGCAVPNDPARPRPEGRPHLAGHSGLNVAALLGCQIHGHAAQGMGGSGLGMLAPSRGAAQHISQAAGPPPMLGDALAAWSPAGLQCSSPCPACAPQPTGRKTCESTQLCGAPQPGAHLPGLSGLHCRSPMCPPTWSQIHPIYPIVVHSLQAPTCRAACALPCRPCAPPNPAANPLCCVLCTPPRRPPTCRASCSPPCPW